MSLPPLDNEGNPVPHTQLALRDYQELPDEMLLRVFLALIPRYPRALSALSLVSRRFRNLTSGDDLWRPIFAHFYGEEAEKAMAELFQQRPSISWQKRFGLVNSLSCLISSPVKAFALEYFFPAALFPGALHPDHAVEKTKTNEPRCSTVAGGRCFVSKGDVANAYEAPKGARIAKFSYDEKHLYALTFDGQIFQWDRAGDGIEQLPIKTFKIATLNVDRDAYQSTIIIKGENLVILWEGEEGYSILNVKTGQTKEIDLRGKAFPDYENRPYRILGSTNNRVYVFYDNFHPAEPDEIYNLFKYLPRVTYTVLKVGFSTEKTRNIFRCLCVYNLEDGSLLQKVMDVENVRGPFIRFGDLFFATSGHSPDDVSVDTIIIFDLRDEKQIDTIKISNQEEDRSYALTSLISICNKYKHLMEPEQKALQKISKWFSEVFE